MNIYGIFASLRRVVFLGLIVVVATISLLLMRNSYALRAERQKSFDLNQEILGLERAITLTETLQEYTGEVARETGDLERSIDRAAGTKDRLSPDVVSVIERLRQTAPGAARTP